MPERNFLISPPGIPLVGWELTHEEPPNEVPLAEDLHRALEQLRLRREQEDWKREGAGGASDDMSENEDGVLLIPEVFGLGAVWDSSLLPRVCRLPYTHLLLVQVDIVEVDVSL